MVAPHLPDPKTASEAQLETEADVLQARRLPEDALDFYNYALARGGGDRERIFNRMGVAELEIHRPEIARVYFKHAIELKKKDAEAWNNLGAAEYMAQNPRGAVPNYQRAVKLSKKNAIFHANLGTAYFELRDFENARQQFDQASRLDPEVFTRGGWGGTQIEVLSTQDRGKFCFEMARLAARNGNDGAVIEWLGKSAEAGFDIKTSMADEKDFLLYRKDPRVVLLIRNAQALHGRQIAVSEPLPPLPPGEGKAKVPR